MNVLTGNVAKIKKKKNINFMSAENLFLFKANYVYLNLLASCEVLTQYYN